MGKRIFALAVYHPTGIPVFPRACCYRKPLGTDSHRCFRRKYRRNKRRGGEQFYRIKKMCLESGFGSISLESASVVFYGGNFGRHAYGKLPLAGNQNAAVDPHARRIPGTARYPAGHFLAALSDRCAERICFLRKENCRGHTGNVWENRMDRFSFPSDGNLCIFGGQ